MSSRIVAALTIAGSDSSAGAGIQADLKTFAALGVYGATAIAAVTAQNTLGVTAIHPIPPQMIAAQIDAVFADLNVQAVKTGMLQTKEAIAVVSEHLRHWASGLPIVVDPVMMSTSGSNLLEPDAHSLLKTELLPLATLLTPNLHEAAALLGEAVADGPEAMREQAARLVLLGPKAVLLKGGHGKGESVVDVLCDGRSIREFIGPRIQTRNTHGTGCTLSAAITAYLAQGASLDDAILRATAYLREALRNATSTRVGAGPGPVSHFYHREPKPHPE